MRFNIELTWSKIMATIIIGLATLIDLSFDKGGQVFTFSLPFVVFLITGKQVIDMKKEK